MAQDQPLNYSELGIIVYNVINKRLPQWLFTLPTVSDMNEHDVNTRQQQHLYVPKCNTCLGVSPFKWLDLLSGTHFTMT